MVVVIFQVSCLYYHFTWAGSNLSWIDSSHAQLNDVLIAIKTNRNATYGKQLSEE